MQRSVTTTPENGNFRVVTVDYNESGKQTMELQELYDAQMNLIMVESKNTTVWYNKQSFESTVIRAEGVYVYANISETTTDGQPLTYRIESQSFSPDSSSSESFLFSTLYEYDNSGALLRTRETRVAYNQDSIIIPGCCGKQFEAESVFTNRCDGTAISKTRRQINYITDTPGDIEAYPELTRELYLYTESICELGGEEPMSLLVFPNPSSGAVTISSELLSQSETRLTILTTDGKLIRQMQTPISTSLALDFNTMTGGLYILRLENGSNHAEEKVLIIQ
ncbi:MAG: T9SS type A sorting domain-containing protein [Cyclobacteriaceae bacterium]|nr:T9SS type A sorting domain-containing protein [Cyclobacteriaceae bacterium]